MLFRSDKHPDQPLARRYGLGRSIAYAWGRHVDRFDFDKEPNEPNRFGWVVEIDPYDPQSMPVKRTALGRFAHEGATYAIARDGRVAIYMGDDCASSTSTSSSRPGRGTPTTAAPIATCSTTAPCMSRASRPTAAWSACR